MRTTHTPPAFPTCARYGLAACASNERVALLAAAIEAAADCGAKAAAVAAAHLITFPTAPDHGLGNAPEGEGMTYAWARVAIQKWKAAQVERKAA